MVNYIVKVTDGTYSSTNRTTRDVRGQRGYYDSIHKQVINGLVS